MKKITKAVAKKLFNEGFNIVLCPNKMMPGLPFSMGCLVSSKEYLENAKRYENDKKLWKGTVEKTAWNLMYNNWSYYNTGYEVGYYAHYYLPE